MSMNIALHERLVEVARAAGRELLVRWPGTPNAPELTVYTKPDGTSVTDADLASNEIVVEGLRRLFPEDGLVSEELPIDPGVRMLQRVWICDPLDGTRSFIAGKDDFSILIGLAVDGEPSYGLMYFPAKAIWASASRGQGAVVNGVGGKVSNASEIRPSSLFLSKCELPGNEKVINEWMDSGMAFLQVAEGSLDGVIIRMTSHQEWDLAAPAVILHESGGRMSDEDGNPIRFNRPKIEFQYLIASNGAVHDELLSLVRGMK
jgi:3'-phosphoadenosine 5'-phosphosulfate (PAPS) 3'-phosphatase